MAVGIDFTELSFAETGTTERISLLHRSPVNLYNPTSARLSISGYRKHRRCEVVPKSNSLSAMRLPIQAVEIGGNASCTGSTDSLRAIRFFLDLAVQPIAWRRV